MTQTGPTPTIVHGIVVEEHVQFSLQHLSRVCSTETVRVIELVHEGVLRPSGNGPDDWQFDGLSLRRARKALRLSHDLELTAASTALVLSLLDEIDDLRAQLQRGRTG
ncbi:MAG: chaperone modulator CbpM [Rhizobacter sp.]